ncbi:MAG: FAD-dependent urate hydroxylase, partial [Mycobacterium sp.]|nr:FAD-dependent urate hydroxylase [Mycobacterium sp.]
MRHGDETGRESISKYARRGSSAELMPLPNAPSTPSLRILVVGAGVGGISVARGLLRDGHDVTVFEQRPEVKAGGGAV